MSAGKTINEQLGLKPKTRRRAATHSPGIVSGARCPKCPGRHVVQHKVHGRWQRLCGFCGEMWSAENDVDESDGD